MPSSLFKKYINDDVPLVNEFFINYELGKLITGNYSCIMDLPFSRVIFPTMFFVFFVGMLQCMDEISSLKISI